jgi:hypothetical protein
MLTGTRRTTGSGFRHVNLFDAVKQTSAVCSQKTREAGRKACADDEVDLSATGRGIESK